MIDLYPFMRPFIYLIHPEAAHNMTISALKRGLSPVCLTGEDDPCLQTQVFGLQFPNPVGLAAGFDKNAEVCDAMLRTGFGFVEAGTVTPRPQAGNDKPRLFRLREDQAVINRFGFNNDGIAAFGARLEKRRHRPGIAGANIGANKDSTDRTADYVTALDSLYGLSSYFTVNISSPNTPGLRALQSRAALDDLLGRVTEVRTNHVKAGESAVPILLKVAPDLQDADKEDIISAVRTHALDGLIVSNTTITRSASLQSRDKDETGGLSGAPLMDMSTAILKDFYRLSGGTTPLIGVGGISSGADAYRKIRAGASLVQLYSALVFKGPGLVTRIKRDLAAALKADGFERVNEAVGADVLGTIKR